MKRILVVTDNDLLLVGIERLLTITDEFPISKYVSRDENEIIRHIQETAPEVVIVDGTFEKTGSLQLTHLLDSMKDLRLLILQVDSNHIQVYEKREVLLQHAADLTAFI